jgi:hypothetical protein
MHDEVVDETDSDTEKKKVRKESFNKFFVCATVLAAAQGRQRNKTNQIQGK